MAMEGNSAWNSTAWTKVRRPLKVWHRYPLPTRKLSLFKLEQAKAKKKTSTESPTPHPAEERQPSSPIYEKRTPMTSMRTTWASQPSHSRTTRLDRTPDLVLAKQVLTPLRYIPALSVCYFCGIGHYHLPIHTTPVAVDDCEALWVSIHS
nr:uncharacterized protein LOC106025875 isoform X6 [Cavia porcellus]